MSELHVAEHAWIKYNQWERKAFSLSAVPVPDLLSFATVQALLHTARNLKHMKLVCQLSAGIEVRHHFVRDLRYSRRSAGRKTTPSLAMIAA